MCKPSLCVSGFIGCAVDHWLGVREFLVLCCAFAVSLEVGTCAILKGMSIDVTVVAVVYAYEIQYTFAVRLTA